MENDEEETEAVEDEEGESQEEEGDNNYAQKYNQE